MITPELKKKFDVLLGYYPADQRQAAVIPLLHLTQDVATGNYLTAEAQQMVADYIGMPVSKVKGSYFSTRFKIACSPRSASLGLAAA